MRVRFRGVRGSVPWGVPAAAGYGCNTACIEIVDERTDRALILDAGTGILGVESDARDVAVLLTHYHWDHVLGLPYFAPLFDATRNVTLHAPRLPGHDPQWLETLFGAPFFPMSSDKLPRPLQRAVDPGPVAVDGFTVSALALNHPGGAFAYRITGHDADVVYATDHEFGDPAFDEPLGAFVDGAASVILDAHYTPDERPRFAGWGHSDWRQCAAFAAAHRVGSLHLFHHKPGRTDADVDAIERAAREVFPATHAAREGWTLTV